MSGKHTLSRRDFLRLSAAGATGAILAACAPAAPEIIEVEKEVAVEKIVVQTVEVEKEVRVEVEARPEAPVEILWTSWATDTYGMFRCEEQYDMFKEDHPFIVVQIRNVGSGYRERLLTALAGGTGPDVYRICTDDFLPFWEQDQLEQLDPWFEQTTDSWMWGEDLKPGVIDSHRVGGKLWFMPMGGEMEPGLLINKDIFDEMGVEYPPVEVGTDEWTYDALLEGAKALTKLDAAGKPEYFGINASLQHAFGKAHCHNFSNGGYWCSEDTGTFTGDDPDLVQGFQFLADLRNVHEVAPTPEQAVGGAFGYVQGRLAMSWSGVSQVAYRPRDIGTRFNWDLAPQPRWGDNELQTYLEYCFWCFNPNSTDKDATWTFYEWLTGPKGQQVPAELGWAYPIYTSLNPLYNKRIAEWNKSVSVAIDTFDFANKWFPWLKNPNWREAHEID